MRANQEIQSAGGPGSSLAEITGHGCTGSDGRGRELSVAGRRVPYPEARSLASSNWARSASNRESKPAVRIRSELHRLGLRFRKEYRIILPGAPVRADIVFTASKLVVFVDGCFWHSCPQHGRIPGRNSNYWEPKLENNVARDRRVDLELARAGWHVLRVWEHVPPHDAAVSIASVLKAGEYA